LWVWFVAGLAGIALVLVLLLCVPVALEFQVDVAGTRSRARARLAWLFGAAAWELRRKERQPKRAERARRARRPPRRWRAIGRQLLAVVRTPGIMPQAGRFLRAALHSLKIRDLAVDLRVGLEDPFETGMLFAAIGPVLAFVNAVCPRSIVVEPSFRGEYVLEGNCTGALRFLPVVLLGACLRLALSGPVLRAVVSSVGTAWKARGR
jgi:hypothetical protein